MHNNGEVVALRRLPHGPTFPLGDLPQDTLTIGSDPACDLCVPAPDLPPVHCFLEVNHRRVYVHACTSAAELPLINGVEADGARLRVGDVLELGSVRLVACGASPECNTVKIVARDLNEFLRAAVAAHGSLRSAAEAVGLPYSTLRGWLKVRGGKPPTHP